MQTQDAPVNVEEVLDGVAFPAQRSDLITYAQDNEAGEEAMELIRVIPDGTYQSMEEVNAKLGLVEQQPGSENLWSSQKAKIN